MKWLKTSQIFRDILPFQKKFNSIVRVWQDPEFDDNKFQEIIQIVLFILSTFCWGQTLAQSPFDKAPKSVRKLSGVRMCDDPIMTSQLALALLTS